MKKIAEGVATLAASVYPKRIIVRLSDFKSNEWLVTTVDVGTVGSNENWDANY